MKPYKTLIVENDEASLNDLLHYLNEYSSIVMVSSIAKNCAEAISLLMNESYLLTILDVELSDGTCFDIINKVPRDRFGEIVSYTGFGNKYIEDLFNINPIGYLPKPPSLKKVQEILIKVDESYSKKITKKYIELSDLSSAEKFYVLVSLDDILFIRVEEKKCIYHYRKIEKDNKIKHYTAYRPGAIHDQITALTTDFVQCSKSEIINVNYFERYQKTASGNKYIAHFDNNQIISLSKNYMDVVFQRKGVIGDYE